MSIRRPLLVLACVLPTLAPAAAHAHIAMSSPAPRHTEQKAGPCGIANDMRGDTITTYKPGETITVTWMETINHPSHYRISFDDDGFDGFVDPATADELYSNSTVLLDGIADANGGMYMAEVTLPDIQCDNCTLQLVQVMLDKPPYGDGNDLYYQCADLILEGPVMGTTGTTTDGTTDGTTGGTSGTTGAETSGATTDATTTAGSSSGSASGSSTDGSTGSGGTTGSSAGSGDTSAASTGATSGGGDESEGGCSCSQGQDRGFLPGLGLAALVLVARRRRRCG